ncbi:MAG TPA: methyltransferase domain-containing protein [Blastocatellia bacterium]|nr:methyltransferase domain-containing protein [Blastocatellia bacterium]
MGERYEKQDRGAVAAYEAYFAGMDRSMQQKVALTTAYFPTRGRIADMGSGSGSGTYDLACLYHSLELVGVDINPASVTHSAERYKRPNLRYVVGDISEKVFPDGSLDGILNSSVFHHVTTFNDYDLGKVFTTLDNQVAQLAEGGVVIIRDFVIPDGPEKVFLDLPQTDGLAEGNVPQLSTASLFELFARNFRSSVNRTAAVPFIRRESPRPGFARYELALRAAAEFVLRKDYRADWDTELVEEYTYLTQSHFESAFRERGLRIVVSMPIWNPWIVQKRFKEKFFLSALDGEVLAYPPTNYLIVGEKVSSGASVALAERARRELETPRFLSLKGYRHRSSGVVYELAERPNLTLDLVPWFEVEGQIFILARKDSPRPIVNACADQPSLNRSTLSGYVTEPISAIVDSKEDPLVAAGRILLERSGISASDIEEIGPEFNYFTSPGGIDERVSARLVRVRPWNCKPYQTPNYTSFTGAGTVRELDAVQVLRACKVGGLFDARLEINIYRLLSNLGKPAGPWIGAPCDLTSQEAVINESGEAALRTAAGAAFESAGSAVVPRFLSLRDATFVETDRGGQVLSESVFEYVVPRVFSRNTVVVVPVAKVDGRVLVGLEHRDLPAVQRFTGNSSIAVAPAWRLPDSVRNEADLENFMCTALHREFGVTIRRQSELGGAYFATPGVTPEVVYPRVVEIDAHGAKASPLRFIEVSSLVDSIRLIEDAHLLVTAFRLAHLLGRLSA